jgi:hypothetical protein
MANRGLIKLFNGIAGIVVTGERMNDIWVDVIVPWLTYQNSPAWGGPLA